MSIFVSIAAYRDPDLVPTIRDCVARARWPGELRFGLCWQHGEGEARPPKLSGRRMRVIDVPWRDSQGACWARAEIMKLYDGEDHFLQLDSHHRFARDWDALLLDQAERSGAALPLLTTYGRPFDPAAPLPGPMPTSISLHSFRHDGLPIQLCRERPDWEEGRAPERARLLSAHLLFAPGRFVEDVPYDPDLYFYGEEITLAARAFTHGYDLFHPGVHILWHQEPRRVTPLHWDDHVAAQQVAVTAQARDAASMAKVRHFLNHPGAGALACGTSRSFAQYEAYAGFNFRRRHATPAAHRGDPPEPPPDATPQQRWTVRIRLDRETLPASALDRPRFWYVGFHDESGTELTRQDARLPEISRALAAGAGEIVLERAFEAPRPPARWTVWPTDRSGCWLDRIEGAVDSANLVSARSGGGESWATG